MVRANITFGLVNIPVTLNSIIKNNDTSFNQLHKKCLNRVKYVKYCSYCKKDLKETDIIKGYQFEKDNYLIFDKDELNRLKPEMEKEIEVVSFIKESEVNPIYFEKSYYLNVDGRSKSYNLFYQALKRTKLIALCKCVLSSKFYYSILKLESNGLIMTTLYFNEEVNMPDSSVSGKVNDKELNLAIKLIETMKGKFEPEKYKDEYQDNIKSAIDLKLNGKEIKGKKKKPAKQVKNLMDALEKSLREK